MKQYPDMTELFERMRERKHKISSEDAKRINDQAIEHVQRVYDFEKPFPPEESTYSPPVLDYPRPLKIKRD